MTRLLSRFGVTKGFTKKMATVPRTKVKVKLPTLVSPKNGEPRMGTHRGYEDSRKRNGAWR